MALVQGDDVVQQFTSATANPALSNSVLPRALDGGLKASNPHGSNRRGNFQPVLCVVIEDEGTEERTDRGTLLATAGQSNGSSDAG